MEQVRFRILVQCTTFLIVGTAGIAAEKYSHVKYFPNSFADDDYYDIAVDIGEVGVDSFATRIQEMLVDYLRDKHGDKVAIGATISLPASVAGCVSPIVVMQGATTIWGWRSHGVKSSEYAQAWIASQSSSVPCVSSSAASSARSIGTAFAKKATATLSFAIRLQPRACTTRFRMYTPRPSARAL